jgi:hypothetical protein
MIRGRPRDDVVEIELQVHDRLLSAPVTEVRVVRAVNDVEHDRAWAEVERNAVADVITGVTSNRERETSLLDAAHPDRGDTAPACDHRSVGEQAAVADDRRKVVDVGNVKDPRSRRDRHAAGGYRMARALANHWSCESLTVPSRCGDFGRAALHAATEKVLRAWCDDGDNGRR